MLCEPKSFPSSHPCSVKFTSLRQVALHTASRGGTRRGEAGSELDPSLAQNEQPRHTKDDRSHNAHKDGLKRCCSPARQQRDEPQPAASGLLAGLSVARMATLLTELAYGPQSRSGRGMSLPVSPDEEGVMSDNAVPCGITPSCANAVSSISEAKRRKTKITFLVSAGEKRKGGRQGSKMGESPPCRLRFVEETTRWTLTPSSSRGSSRSSASEA